MTTSPVSEKTTVAAPEQTPTPVQEKMRPWAVVAGREIKVKLTDKNFIFSTLFTLVLMAVVFGVQAFFISQASESSVGVVDEAGAQIVFSAEAASQADDSDVVLNSVMVDDIEAGKLAVSDGELDAVLYEQDGTWTLGSDGIPGSDILTPISEVVQSEALERNASAAGATLTELTQGSEIATEDVSGADSEEQLAIFIAGLVFAVLFYIASLMFGMSIATSVIEEKQSRIVEIITAAIPTSQLLAGKVLGNTVLAFAQMVLLLGVAFIGISFTQFDTFLPLFTEPLLWYLPFFVVGFVALACIWAAAGALGSRSEDLQTTTLPLTLTLVGLFLLALNLDGFAAQIASFVPVMSTFMMPLRILEGDVSWWQPTLALLITLGFSWLTIKLGARLYRRGLLQTQGRLGLKEALSGS